MAASIVGSGLVPGQSIRYDCPSKSSSAWKHPLILTTVASAAGTQKTSSPSGALPAGSDSAERAQLKFASSSRQFSKCPISSENATLYVCADHVLPRGFAVLYSGWKAYGSI